MNPRLPLTPLNWMDQLADKPRNALHELLRERQIRKGELVWSKGDPSLEMYQVVSGRVSLYSLTETGKALLYYVFGRGDCFGENSMMDNKRRHHMAQADEDTVLVQLSLADYQKLYIAYPDINVELLRQASRRTRLQYDYIDSLLLMPMEARIALRICIVLDGRGREQESDCRELALEVTQEELGHMLGTTRQTISRVLAKWQEQGIVEMHYGKIQIKDPRELHRICLGDTAALDML